MPVKLHNIKLSKGDSLTILFDGSVEHSLHVWWTDTRPSIRGPANCTVREFDVAIDGLKEVKRERGGMRFKKK
jgi:hypothetical protein